MPKLFFHLIWPVVSLTILSGSLPAFANLQCGASFFTIEGFDGAISELAKMRMALDQNSANLTAKPRHFRIYAEKFSGVAKASGLTEQQLTELVREKIVSEKRPAPSKSNKDIMRRPIFNDEVKGERAIFNRVLPGSFDTESKDHPGKIIISRPFFMMSTKVTNKIYSDIENIHGTMIKTWKGNEGLKASLGPTCYGIEQWLKKLNDLSAEGSPLLRDIIPDHLDGDRYRLPTEAEWLLVLKARGRRSYQDIKENLLNEAEITKAAHMSVAKVGSKHPVNVDGFDFYDLLGISSEWTMDAFDSGSLRPGIDPVKNPAASTTVRRTVVGISRDFENVEDRKFADPSSAGFGFRLVREAREWEQ